MKPNDLGTLFDDLLDRGTRTAVHLDRPLDIAPEHGTGYDVAGLAALVRNAAGWLHAAGVRRGDRVAVIKPNHWDYVLLACAAARIGAVPALLSDHLPAQTAQVLLKRLDPALLVTTAVVLDAARDEGADLAGLARRALVLDGRRTGALDLDSLRGACPPAPVRRAPGDPLVVHHTSGTTGTPKLVVHTTETLIRTLAARESRRLPVVSSRRDDTVASAIAHAHGRAVPWTASVLWLAPRKLVVLGGDSPDVLRAHPPTTLEALPSTYVRWQRLAGPRGPFRNVRLFISTFDAMHPPTVRAFLHGTRRSRPLWVQVWGQTETGPMTFRFLTRRSVAATGERHPTTRDLGRPVPGHTRLRVVDPTTFQDVPAGVPGLVLVRTPARCADYVGEPERWAAKATGPWWNSGDLGVRTRTGTYLLLDREVDTLPGHSCVELEDVITDRLPTVDECVVLATPGALPTPVVVTADGALDPTAWATAVRDLPALAAPVLLPHDRIPRTATGKVRRAELRAHLRHSDRTFGTGDWT